MLSATKWQISRFPRSAISTYANRSVNLHAWRYIATEWNEYGARTKVMNDRMLPTIGSNQFMPHWIRFCAVLSLQELCCRTIVRRTSVYAIDTLPLPPSVKSNLKSYALTSSQGFNTLQFHSNKKGTRCRTPTQNSGVASCGPGNSISIGCGGAINGNVTRNSCSISWFRPLTHKSHSAQLMLHGTLFFKYFIIVIRSCKSFWFSKLRLNIYYCGDYVFIRFPEYRLFDKQNDYVIFIAIVHQK